MTLSWKKIGAYCGILGGILFVIITFIIMLIYPGGYSFLENSFSSLGLTETNGQPTMLNYILFSIACTSAAICSVPFWLAIRTVFEEPGRLKMLGWLGLILGFIAAPNLSALALFAGNVFPAEHGLTTRLFFIFYTLAIVVYSIAILMKEDYENIFAFIGFIVAAICFLHIGGMLVSALAVFASAAVQKVAVYALILWSAFQSYKLLKVFE